MLRPLREPRIYMSDQDVKANTIKVTQSSTVVPVSVRLTRRGLFPSSKLAKFPIYLHQLGVQFGISGYRHTHIHLESQGLRTCMCHKF